MARSGYQPGAGIRPVCQGALVPGDVPAEERAAGGAGALAGDYRELFWGLGELVKVGDGADEGGEASGGGGEPGGGGEVVGGYEAEGVGGEGGEGGAGAFEVGAEGAEGGEAGGCAGGG